jgi:hypothetical protein
MESRTGNTVHPIRVKCYPSTTNTMLAVEMDDFRPLCVLVVVIRTSLKLIFIAQISNHLYSPSSHHPPTTSYRIIFSKLFHPPSEPF